MALADEPARQTHRLAADGEHWGDYLEHAHDREEEVFALLQERVTQAPWLKALGGENVSFWRTPGDERPCQILAQSMVRLSVPDLHQLDLYVELPEMQPSELEKVHETFVWRTVVSGSALTELLLRRHGDRAQLHETFPVLPVSIDLLGFDTAGLRDPVALSLRTTYRPAFPGRGAGVAATQSWVTGNAVVVSPGLSAGAGHDAAEAVPSEAPLDHGHYLRRNAVDFEHATRLYAVPRAKLESATMRALLCVNFAGVLEQLRPMRRADQYVVPLGNETDRETQSAAAWVVANNLTQIAEAMGVPKEDLLTSPAQSRSMRIAMLNADATDRVLQSLHDRCAPHTLCWALNTPLTVELLRIHPRWRSVPGHTRELRPVVRLRITYAFVPRVRQNVLGSGVPAAGAPAGEFPQ